MFPQQLRLNNLYRNMDSGPDFNAGMPDIESLFSRIMELRNNQRMRDYNEQQNEMFQQEQKQNRLQAIAHAAALTDASKPKNVVFGGTIPSAFPIDDQSHEIFGYKDPKLAAIAQRAAAVDQSNQTKRDIADQTDEYRNELLMQRGKLGEEANRIRANRADIYRYKAMNPNMKFMVSRGGNIFAFNPTSGEGFDTGVDSGTLSDQDRLELLGKQHLSEIGARGTNAATLEGIRQSGRLSEIAARVSGQKEVNAAKPQRGELPTQTRVRQNITLHQFINQYPELAKWINFNTDGTFTMKRNVPENIKTQINQVVYGSSTGSTSKETSPPKKEDKKKDDPLGLRGGG